MNRPNRSTPTTIKPAKLRSRVWSYRICLGITQQQLAKRVGVSRYAIHKIETGKSTPSILLALCIAKELDTTTDDLFRLA